MLAKILQYKKHFLPFLPTIIILGIFFTLFHDDFNRNSRKELKELKALNDSLKIENQKIMQDIKAGEEDMAKQDEIIKTLFEETFLLKEQLSDIKQEFKNVKNKYEKAKVFSDSFGSDDIKRYFSEL